MALRGVVTASNTANATSESVDVSTITGFAAGDIILLAAYVDTSGATFTWPSGFATTGLSNLAPAGSGGTSTCGIQYKVATGTESTLTVSTSGSNLYTLTARVYSGRSSTPLKVSPTSTGPIAMGPSPITLAINGLTANSGDDLVLFVFPSASSGPPNWTFTPPSGYADSRLDIAGTTSFSPPIASCDNLNVASGATGTLGGSISWSGGTNEGYAAYLFSLAAAAGGATLTGATGTFSLTDPTPGTAVSLSGQSQTGSQGTVGISVTRALIGRGITSSLGIMGVVGQHGLGANLYEGTSTPNNAITLSGLTIGSAAGLVSANGDVTVSLAGLGMASAEGFVTPSGGALVVGLTGLAITSSEGTFGVSLVINPANDINITLVGLAVALSEGSFSTSLSAGLPSALLTSYAGTVNAISGLVIPITGLLGTFTEGAFTPAKTGTLTGLSSQAAYGIITFNEKGGMPNLYGLNYYEAQNALQAVGIYVPVPAFAFQPPQITVEWVQSDQPGGLVVAQSPAYGSAVKPGAPVTLTISIFDVGSIIE